LITGLETRPEADLTAELVKNKLIEECKRRNQYSTAATYGDHENQAAPRMPGPRGPEIQKR